MKQKETPKGEPTPEVSEAKARGKALWAVLISIVDARIAGDRKHGWVADDSMPVIEGLVAEDASLSKCGDVAKFTLSDEALAMIKAVVNPSGFRQQLEDPKGLNRLDKSENKRGGSLKNLEAQYGD